MVARGVDRRSLGFRIVLLAALMPGGAGCVSVGDGSLHFRGGRGERTTSGCPMRSR